MKLSFFSGINIFKKTKKISQAPHKTVSCMVEPLQTDFKSTKEMFAYAKTRCIKALKSQSPYEHVVLADIKQNRVLAEFKGNSGNCDISEISTMKLDKDNTVLLHGHPHSTPISSIDVSTMLNYPVTQVIAFDKNGKFSLVAKNIDRKDNVKKEFIKYRLEQCDMTEGLSINKAIDLYNYATDKILKKHAPLMGIRYVSNYDYLMMK